MSPSSTNHGGVGDPAVEDFTQFFDRWITEQDVLLRQLLQAATRFDQEQQQQKQEEEEEEEEEVREGDLIELKSLTERAMAHYEQYYRAKSASADADVLQMFTHKWRSKSENLFVWVGGWQPSAAFHLLYSKQGHQLLPRLDDILRGADCRMDLADITHSQMERLDALQRRVIGMEREINEEEAVVQSTVAGSALVGLAHVITQMKVGDGDVAAVEEEEGLMGVEMEEIRAKMVKVLARADELRLETLKSVMEILEPLQAVHFLISAAEVHLRVHEWGKQKDLDRERRHSDQILI